MCSALTALLYVITAAQVALYVVALWQNDWLVEQLARNPLVGPSETRVHTLGALAHLRPHRPAPVLAPRLLHLPVLRRALLPYRLCQFVNLPALSCCCTTQAPYRGQL